MRPLASVIIGFCLVLSACDATVGGTDPETTSTIAETTSQPTLETTTTAPTPDPDTTEPPEAQVELIDVAEEAPPWEDVTITTSDGVDLNARLWEGNETAILHLHDFSNLSTGSAGQRPLQDADTILPYSAGLARRGFTVLSLEWRGHGQSSGDISVPESPIDLEAGYTYLIDQGYDKVIVVGWLGAATAAAVADAESDAIALDGIAFLFSPPQDRGLDANVVLDQLDIPTLFIGSNAGRSASWARRMGDIALDARDIYVFERVPSGLLFIDVFGPELAGRIAEFADNV